ncbi:MAG TPA: ribosomal-protein-alanine N-acetyltransferase [Acidilobales archaeon]|nr:ribosomal-protein-alanine N-acetyltransferase [Acidilobales archaeon]
MSKEFSFVIREAKESDLRDVININLLTLPEHYPESFWRDHLIMWGKAFLVAEVSSKIVGYVMCRVESGFGHIKRSWRRLGHIISIAVLPEFRRRGIGTALLKEAIERLKKYYNVDEVYLEVRVSNEAAINLYKKLDFKIVKVIKFYYLDGEDAYLMAKEI